MPAGRRPRWPGRRWRGGPARVTTATPTGGTVTRRPLAVADPAVDHVPGVLGVAQDGVHGLGGPPFPGGGGVAGRVCVEPGGDGGHAELVHDPPGEDLLHHRGPLRVQRQPGLGAALGGLGGDRVRDPVGEVAVGGGADVPPVQGVLDQPFPGFLLQLQPEPFRHALLHPADENRGGVDAFDDGGLVGGEQRDPGPGQLLLQFQGVEGVPAGPLDVLADHRGELRGGGGGLGEQVGHAAVAGDVPGDGAPGGWPRPRASRSRPPDSTSQYQAVMNHPAGSQALAARICRLSEARGSCISKVEVRPRNATGTGSPGPASGGRPRRRRASGAWFVLALPLEYLHDHFRLPRVNQLRAFPGGDADLEPDLYPARPFPRRYIIADHTPIRCYSRQITMMNFPAFPRLFLVHFPFSSRAA